MSAVLNADLHCHSTVSDGAFAPADVARRAHEHGVTLWALTDHDEVGGQAEARKTAETLGMNYLCGVEISVTWASRTVHVVGLHIDPACQALVEGLERTRNGRQARAEAMSEQLDALGIPDTYEAALKLAPNADMISRTHFARCLVENGHCKSTQDAFDRYLADGAISANTPINVAISKGARRLIILPTGYACASDTPPVGAVANALHALTLLIARQMVDELEDLPPDIEYYVVPPLCPLVGSPYDFSRTSDHIEAAIRNTDAWLAQHGLDKKNIPLELRPHDH